LVFYSSTITMLHGPINIRFTNKSVSAVVWTSRRKQTTGRI